MMQDDDPLQEAADAVADGIAVDWEALAARLTSAADRQRLENLRLIAAIKGFDPAGSGPDELVTGPAPAAVRADPLLKRLGSLPRPVHLAPDPSAAQAWGRYRLLEEVGAGSFGRVYRAWDPNLERHVAVKILHAGAARVLLEGKQLARLRDPNVVSVLDIEEHDGQFGLCMEFVDGETLDDVLKSRGTLNAREAVLVGQDVCRALHAAHAAGLLHRDVKARNIMRDRAGRIVLMDFGAGREIEELERADPALNMAGTPLYMAPEVLAGHVATCSSDLYSVGVLLYYLVTGSYPVTGTSLKEIRTAHMFGMREPIGHRRTDLPPAFVRIVERATAANPEQRYRSAAGMLDDLAAANVPHVLPADERHPLVYAAAGSAAALVAVTALGAVITRYFNVTMGRTEFATDGLRDWLRWGLGSLVTPIVYFGFVLIAVALLIVLHPFVLRVYPGVARLEARCAAWVRRCELDKPDELCRCVLLLSVVLVATACWWLSDMLTALFVFPDVSSAPAWQLQRLSPAFKADHLAYRKLFMVVAIACAVMWCLPVWLGMRRRQPVNRLLLAGGGAVTLLALLLFSFPYRVLSQNGDFEVARWQQARCYILGEKEDTMLLFCPALEPRSRVVTRAGDEVQRTGVRESPFTSFSPTMNTKRGS